MTEKFVRDYVEALRQYFSAKTTAENKEALAKRLRETQPLITEQEFLRRIEPLFNGPDHTLLRLPGDGMEHILDKVEYSGGRDTHY